MNDGLYDRETKSCMLLVLYTVCPFNRVKCMVQNESGEQALKNEDILIRKESHERTNTGAGHGR